MSYCVEYNPELKKHYPSVTKSGKKPPIALILGVVITVAAAYALVSSGVLRYLIPGDPEVTTAAFSVLVERIGAGEPVREAFLGFCEEIIVNAS